jgi:hypothetical protein
MSKAHRRTLLLVALVATLSLILESVAVVVLGAEAPSWSHWLCSPSSIHSARHAILSGGLGKALSTSLKLLAVHWPHLLPIPLGLATLAYLHRANARYHRQRQRSEAQPSSA